MLIRFLDVYGYHLFMLIGAISILILMFWRRYLYTLSAIQAILYALIIIVTGIFGTKVLFFFECGMESFSGMSVFGAIYLVLLVMPLLGLVFNLKPKDSLDACAPCGAAMIGFQRFGCYCAGCCGGIPIGSSGIVWPTQLMEGFGDMIILMFLLRLEQRKKLRGYAYSVFLISYGSLRFFVEFFRDTVKDWGGFSHGQWFSFIGIVIAILLIVGDKNAKSRKKFEQ